MIGANKVNAIPAVVAHLTLLLQGVPNDIATDSTKALLKREPWLSFSLASISGWASILSLLLTGWVWLELRNIRKTYLFRARVPEINVKLSKFASEIADGMNNYNESTSEIAVAVGQSDALLKSLHSKTSGSSKSQAKTCLGLASAYLREPSEAKIRELYVALRKLEAAVEEQLEDLKWEGG
jgi:hypothetical protein